jgi:hypothetical protein
LERLLTGENAARGSLGAAGAAVLFARCSQGTVGRTVPCAARVPCGGRGAHGRTARRRSDPLLAPL